MPVTLIVCTSIVNIARKGSEEESIFPRTFTRLSCLP